MSTFDLQRTENSFVLDFLLSDSLAATVLGTPMKDTAVENSALVLDLGPCCASPPYEKFSWFLSIGV